MSLRFGTDGMRGVAGRDLTTAVVEALGRAGAEKLGGDGFAVGRDTRESGPDLCRALHRGVARAGGRSVDLGMLPTPAVARWCDDEQVAGAVVSASHNPWVDNGLKLFAPGGRKLSDRLQDSIQERFDELVGQMPAGPARHPTPVDAHRQAARRHVDAVVASIDGRSLEGVRVIVDAAHGAATEVAPAALIELGADVTVIHADPDGRNINLACGSTHPGSLQAAVLDAPGSVGLAFDGDAERVLAVDERGEVVDGDQIIAVCAIDRAARGVLAGRGVVVTVMTNLGFRRSMKAHDITVVDTAVGDRHVLEAVDEGGFALGGEQSGHVIFRELATTGDGLLTSVQLLDVMRRRGSSLADLHAAAMTRLPQVLRGVPLTGSRSGLDALIDPIVAESAARLGANGRILVRASGTEPLVRVMVEADEVRAAEAEAARVSEAVEAALTRRSARRDAS
ncbi:MAG: phosphoglucosamine mutase [Acidimicrobiales bacterium]